MTPEAKFADAAIADATADYQQSESPLEPNFDDRSNKSKTVGPVSFAIDGKDDTAWAIDAGPGRRNQDRKAVFRLKEPVALADGAEIAVSFIPKPRRLEQRRSSEQPAGPVSHFAHRLARAAGCRSVAPSRARNSAPFRASSGPRPKRPRCSAIGAPPSPEWQPQNEAIEALWRQWPEGTTALVLEPRERAARDAHAQAGRLSQAGRGGCGGRAGHPAPAARGAPPTRLTLARWLADRRSPTTARVAVNRVWQAYFGTGLVATSEDFGTQSEPPSHPALARLAGLRVHGRRLEHEEAASPDRRVGHLPAIVARHAGVVRRAIRYNRLLARGPRFRVEGELVRDIALAASGRLNPKLGGPSIFAPIPDSLLALSYAPLTWNTETGPDRYRRALYTFRRRSLPYPVLQNFDAPNGDFSCVRRQRSNTPLQALTTLNEVIFVECARALARRMLETAGPSDAERVTLRVSLLSSAGRRATRNAARWSSCSKRNGGGSPMAGSMRGEVATGKNELPANLPAGVTPTQLAAYTVVARVLLNLDETITKE